MISRMRLHGDGAPGAFGVRAAIGALIAAMVIWLWPVGFGGRMLVGGDVTRFFMGLMAVLGESLQAGRLPIWNDIWGYGFPGLAESQMGVYYPPHVLLYGLFGVETAYVTSLVLHTLWGALGAFWAARKFGISAEGSLLTAFSWSASGFFVIHMSHPWGYSCGSWMPWAWGLTWSILSGKTGGAWFRASLLSVVLFLQLLPGHFQIAFMTQVGIALMLVWRIWNACFPGSEQAEAELVGVRDLRIVVWRRVVLVALGMAVAYPLAALQLVPTARLAQLANQQRDFAYLAGFAATPFHLVSYVAPGLFHHSPTWRPLVWDPFLTSPEEHMAYIGLAPLLLALSTLHDRKKDPGVRALTFLGALMLLLSLGPNVPGFALLIKVPGFSFFRAPARWALPVSLSLALLAGKGLDRWPERRRPVKSTMLFVALAFLWIAGVLSLIELSMITPGRSETASILRRGYQAITWTGPQGWDLVVAAAHQPLIDPTIPTSPGNSNLAGVSRALPSFAATRFAIYVEELGPTSLILLLMLLAGVLQMAKRGRSAVPKVLLILTLADLLLLGRHRMSDLETAPWRPLSEQSPVLAAMEGLPRGTRSADAFRNLPMLAGLAPISAYRTMDLPVAVELTQRAHTSLDFQQTGLNAVGASRAAGVGSRTFDPVENLVSSQISKLQDNRTSGANPLSASQWTRGKPIVDPALASWQYGSAWVARQGEWATTYRLGSPVEPPSLAWLIDHGGMVGNLPDVLAESDAASILTVFERAKPLKSESTRPGTRTVEVEDAPLTGWIVVTILSDPQWKATWIGRDGQGEKPAEIRPVFHGPYAWGWMAVQAPGPGRWSLRLEYHARDVRIGLFVSFIAWVLWIGGQVVARRRMP
jgi:hypothetical protein